MLEFIYFWFKNMTFLSLDGYAYRCTYAGIPSGLLNTQYLDSYCNLFVMVHALKAFNSTDEEIKQIRFFIMGDDNSAFTHWPITKTQAFVKFLKTFAEERYGMKLNEKKSITTDQRQNIHSIVYLYFGNPTRPLDKLLAQLCYPEHGYVNKHMSARAIGIAYASCAQDYTFYFFCIDVFHIFLPYAEPLTLREIKKMKKYLPGVFKLLDEIPSFLTQLEFPTFAQIKSELSRWKGELPFYPKWNHAHFVHPPNYTPPSPITLEEYNRSTNYEYSDPPTLCLS